MVGGGDHFAGNLGGFRGELEANAEEFGLFSLGSDFTGWI